MTSAERLTWSFADLSAVVNEGLHVLCLYPHSWIKGQSGEDHCACGEKWPCPRLPLPVLSPEDVDD